jgi:superfamily II DNA helicase RecQ
MRLLIEAQDKAERQFAEQTREMIEVADDRKEPNEWLDWIGWAKHLEGLNPTDLHATMDPISEDEPRLMLKWEITERVITQARAVANAKVVGAPALFEVQRSDPARKPRRPITNRMEDDTWRRYKEHYRKIMCIVERTETWPEDKRPQYQTTKMQRQCMADWDDAIDRFIEARSRRQTRKHVISGSFARVRSPSNSETDSSDDADSSQDENMYDQPSSVSDINDYQWDQSEAETALESMCLGLWISWFDHPIGHDHYASIIVSSLAVMGIQDEEQGGWESPLNFTPVYSGVIKITRFLVLLHSWREWEAEIESRVASAIDAMQLAPSAPHAQHRKRIERDVREEARSIFTIVRSKVRRFMTRTSDSKEGEPTPMDWMFEARAYGMKIRYNTAAPGTIDWNGNVVVFRDVKFSMAQLSIMLRDLIREARELLAELTMAPGGDVDQLPRIPWDRIEDNHSNGHVDYSFMTDERNTWLEDGKNWVLKQITESSAQLHRWIKARPGDGSPYQDKAVRQYRAKFEQFRERLFMWADDIIRHPKRDGMTAEEDHRMKQEGLDGGDESSSQVSRNDTKASSQEVAEKEEKEEKEEKVEEEIEVPREWQEESTWSNDHIRRILTSHSERLMGSRITISAWRQIAVAIARRYMNSAFGSDETGGPGEDEIDADADDDAVDLQVGHGSLVAGMIYARELQQATFGTQKARDKFRAVSRAWHHFLGFGEDDRSAVFGAKRRREPYEASRDAERARRMRSLRMADVHGSLRSMFGPEAEFRGQQEKVIRSIMQEAGPFVQITGTGGGKSLSFMLPAYCVPGGTTIAIVPLVSLRDDLHSRCKESNIRSITWHRNQGNPPATIVFVTPETAVTKGFRDWVNGVIATGQLDRVVVDECHIILDGTDEFRPELAELGSVIREWGVQRVFLTATLPPEDMEAFFRAAALEPGRTTVFRERTTRPNIRYRVIPVKAKGKRTEEAEDDKVCELVRQWRQQNSSGRIMVYAVERERVDRLAKRLGCPAFHSRVDTKEGKTQRLQRWKDGGDIIVGTKALGLGIDVSDVRLVLHAGMPFQMKDYVQESGRAGRDRQRSEAIVVCAAAEPGRASDGKTKGRKQKRPTRDQAAAAYIQGQGCRREIIDRAMDGFVAREGCGEGEEACHDCQHQAWIEEAMSDMDASDEEVQADRREDAATQAQFQNAQRAQAMVQHEAAMARMTTASTVASFREGLEEWRDRCVVCWENKADESHDVEECPSAKSEDIRTARAWISDIKKEMFDHQGFARFSACFGCGLPQAICDQWETVKGEGMKFQKRQGQKCQYEGLLTKVWAAGLGFYADEVEEVMRKMGWEATEGEDKYTWMGKKVRWSGHETNNMCVGFHRICIILSSKQE